MYTYVYYTLTVIGTCRGVYTLQIEFANFFQIAFSSYSFVATPVEFSLLVEMSIIIISSSSSSSSSITATLRGDNFHVHVYPLRGGIW